jgi:hypothetical protein
MRKLAWCVAIVCTSSALAARPVLHEYFELDDKGQLPSPLQRPSAFPLTAATGSHIPPDPAEAAGAVTEEQAWPSQNPERPSANSEYRLDGNTSQPSEVGYSDPFTPSIPPFKRLYAYDSVNAQLELVVADTSLRWVNVGGVAEASHDQFMGIQSLDLVAGQPVRLPTVGPGIRVLNASLTPGVSFQLFADSAENLFIKADASGTHEWVVHLGIPRATFGAAFADNNWNALAKHLPKLPDVVGTAARPVLRKLELSKSVRPAVALRRMVEYFRSFAPQDEPRREKGEQLYQAIALSQVGVCRHRAFAFVVTGLALGLPSRFIRNEAHAWVEVYDGRLWHRVDLGGAAGEMSLTSDLDVPHESPPDPYGWPPKSESGGAMVDRTLQAAMASSSGNNGASNTPFDTASNLSNAQNTSPNGAPSAAVPTALPNTASPDTALPETAGPPAPVVPATHLTVSFNGASLKRGERFPVHGTARNTRGQPCALMRVDVTLYDPNTNVTFSAGTLVTDAAGKYSGQLVLPQRVPVGDYRVRVSTPGHRSCAATM